MAIITASFLGGITGFFGPIFGRGFAFIERKQQNKHSLELRRLDMQQQTASNAHEITLHELNRKAAKEEGELQIMALDARGSWDGLESSQQAASALNIHPIGSPIVIDILRMVRPVITLLLWILLFAMFILSEPSRVTIVDVIVYCASAATLWWFGDRNQRGNKQDIIFKKPGE